MNFFSLFLLGRLRVTPSKKKQTFDCELDGIISKFVNKKQNAMGSFALSTKNGKKAFRIGSGAGRYNQ
jgi:hypothetical protein